MKIVYQGIPGSYSESCAKENYSDCETIACKTFDECFDIASQDSSIRAILPESNKTTGNIGIEYLIFNRPVESLLNIGSGVEISIYDLAKKIKNVIEFDGELRFDETKPDGNPRKLLDSSIINNLGWSPKISLENGLKLTYEWYLNSL